MRKVALVFVIAVLVPSLVLAWLALRSQRDLQFLFERQQSLLYQRVTDSLAADITNRLAQTQQEFNAQVETLVASNDTHEAAVQFDDRLRQHWPLADIGFCVTLSGTILSPSSGSSLAAKNFNSENDAFLGNREAVEFYGNNNGTVSFNGQNIQQNFRNANASQSQSALNNSFTNAATAQQAQQLENTVVNASQAANNYRTVNPQNSLVMANDSQSGSQQYNLSKVSPAQAEFAQLVGDGTDGMLARFLQNKLELLFWHRLNRKPDLIFGAQLNLNRVVNSLRDLVQADPILRDDICLALLDDNARPVAMSREKFSANWKRPFVATEIGEALPHWEVAAYLVNPERLTQAARNTRITLGLLIDVLLLAIGIGSWLIARNLNAELKLARQKTDFVSNVSHELKTPLTSIRMFSELLAENRVADESKRRSYLQIISAEAARLTRLINNVLDFSRMESGEKKYNFQPCDLTEVVRTTAETFRPHLEANGFKFDYELPETKISVRSDSDALSQIIVNLLSNAENISNSKKEITLQLAQKQSPLPHAEIRISDRGSGVPRGSEEKIFEKFYRAHDSLSSGIQGSGLGLTIARQIARAHGGDVAYEPRDGGGSCFVLRLPIKTADE